MNDLVLKYFTPVFALLFASSLVWSMVGFLPAPPSVIRIALFFVFFLVYIKKDSIVNKLPLLFILYLFININFCTPESYFRVGERFLMFSLMLVSVGPCFSSYESTYCKHKVLHILILLITILSIGSFFCFFSGLNFMRHDYVNVGEYAEHAGWFSGLFSHSMVLGPMAAIGTTYIMYQFLVSRKKILILLLIPLVGAVLFAASRTALLAMIISTVIMCYHFSINKFQFVRYMCGTIIILTLSFPLWGSAIDRVISKQMDNTNLGQFGSRTLIWENRLDEFKKNPVVGIGFSTVDSESGNVNKLTGSVEPGSSWLAVASMTGIIGLIFFIWIIFEAYRNLMECKNYYSIFLSSLLIFFTIHMVGEGYVFAGGNAVCVFLWLTIGCCYDVKFFNTSLVNESCFLLK